ncbi:MAG: diguanylate cyclase, partial [Actinobacteria bacterium]
PGPAGGFPGPRRGPGGGPGTRPRPVGVGLGGSGGASGDPRRGRVDRDGPQLAADEPACTTYVVVPFSAPPPVVDPSDPAAPQDSAARPASTPRSLGVLALYDRLGSDEFDDSDLVMLRTFAAQAAVAVDNVRIHREAQRLSRTDPLTGLWNYRQLQETLHREIERANRFRRRLTVLALDLDRFKEVHATCGPLAGGAVPKEFAPRIRGEIREIDGAFRNGGEEFVVLLPETDVSGGAVVAERLGAVVRGEPIEVDVAGKPVRIPVTVSIGVAVYPDHGESGQQVLDAADEALYAAKASGRDTYRVAGSSSRSADRDTVPAAVASQEGDVPPAGGASFGPHPPRQTRGR